MSAVARVARVVQFSDLGPRRVAEILKKYGSADGIEKRDLRRLDKRGFGMMSAWITAGSVGRIRK